MKKCKNILLILLFTFLEIFLLSHSKLIMKDFSYTLNICLYTLLPTMFFSLIFSQILIQLKFHNYIPKILKKILKRIFNISDNDVIIFILSILCGYPNNAKMLQNNPNLNNIIQYTNFPNPIFLICTIGGIYLKNIKLSVIILLSQIIGNIILGIVFRKKNINTTDINKIKETNDFLKIYYSSIKSTISTLIIIFSNILFFTIINTLISHLIIIKEPYY